VPKRDPNLLECENKMDIDVEPHKEGDDGIYNYVGEDNIR
jgi:hypothetical protein